MRLERLISGKTGGSVKDMKGKVKEVIVEPVDTDYELPSEWATKDNFFIPIRQVSKDEFKKMYPKLDNEKA